MEDDPSEYTIPQKQQANYLYYLEQEENWWPALLYKYLLSKEDSLPALRKEILENPEEWNTVVGEAKSEGLQAARMLALRDSTQWHRRLAPLLLDPAHQELLEWFLKGLVMLKTKRVHDIGTRAKTRQHINGILAAIGSDALTALERVIYAESHLAGSSAESHPQSQGAHAYYETRLRENLGLLADLLAIYLLFKYARSLEDIRLLQQFIGDRLVKPLKAKAEATADTQESKTWKESANAYQQLIRAVEISFE